MQVIVYMVQNKKNVILAEAGRCHLRAGGDPGIIRGWIPDQVGDDTSLI